MDIFVIVSTGLLLVLVAFWKAKYDRQRDLEFKQLCKQVEESGAAYADSRHKVYDLLTYSVGNREPSVLLTDMENKMEAYLTAKHMVVIASEFRK